MKACGVKYSGPSYPHFHGTTCMKNVGHDVGSPHGDAKHVGYPDGFPLSWFTEEQKAARAAEKVAP